MRKKSKKVLSFRGNKQVSKNKSNRYLFDFTPDTKRLFRFKK